MKIAFCFLTIGNLSQAALWNEFFTRAENGAATLYCHPKEPGSVTDPIIRNAIIPARRLTQHGHVSLVEATLDLFAHAYRADPENEYFLLLSESAIPVVPLGVVLDGLSKASGRSLIPYNIPEGSDRDQRLMAVQCRELFEKRFFKHDQWIVLSRDHVRSLLDRPGLWMFQNVFAPDEHYFMNALVHLKRVPESEIVCQPTTFVNWAEREIRTYVNRASGQVVGRTAHPKTYHALSRMDIERARTGGMWFFRKVSPQCDCAVVMPFVRGEGDVRNTDD